MLIDKKFIENLLFKSHLNNNRFTQNSPIYPEIWLDYFEHCNDLDHYRADLILIPHRNSSAAELLKILLSRFSRRSDKSKFELASTGESVAAKLTFKELIDVALPLTNWVQNYLTEDSKAGQEDRRWLVNLAGAIIEAGKQRSKTRNIYHSEVTPRMSKIFVENFDSFFDLFSYRYIPKFKELSPILWSVSKNREAIICIEKSVPTTKADAGRRLFSIDGSSVTWAILDTGIDARHDAFRKIDNRTKKPFDEPLGSVENPQSNQTRILATYDFTKFRKILASLTSDNINDQLLQMFNATSDKHDKKLTDREINNFVTELEHDLKTGRMLDWSIISPLLRIPHNEHEYIPPVNSHGTHIAGIIGASSTDEITKQNLIGMCPGIQLYDIRVFDESGKGNEFDILAALQFIRWKNSQKDSLVIHGINMSLSMIHEVKNYACGQTPVCVSCERLVSEGTVVVAAAGNLGQSMFNAEDGTSALGFRMVNITDPGNAEAVITVGSTHSANPHSYGVSYFSSKGPTGDGRIKPDLVAPGEKISSSSINNSIAVMEGTSMAAPHVSGAVALLLDKHKELIGKPQKIKKILCETATDLGREKYFQGCGLVDVLRAIQSV